MTDKQENILKSALQLFAEQGYASTSTAKIAAQAGVSEGLIFRHFGNKEGLLKAIMELGKQQTEHLFARALTQSDPQQLIESVLRMPFELDKSAYPFWKLLYSLKWQTSQYAEDMTLVLQEALMKAFTMKGALNPEMETQALMVWMDGIATTLLLHEPSDKEALLQTILEKYRH